MSLDISSITQLIHLTSIFKLGVLILLGIYLIFLFIVYRQVHLMNNVVRQATSGGFLEFLSFFLILIGLALFFIALAIL